MAYIQRAARIQRDLFCVQKLRAARMRNGEAGGHAAVAEATSLPRGAVSPIADSPDSVLSGPAG